MKLRAFALLLTLALGLLVAPLSAEAQKAGKVYRVGRLAGISCADPSLPLHHEAMVQGLLEMGYVEGRDVAIEYRCAEGHPDRFPALTAELLQLKVDVILAVSTPAAQAAKEATATIPIVFFTSDPVRHGLVPSLARPGGNLTGVSIDPAPDFYAKQLQLLKEAVPTVARVGLLLAPYPRPDHPVVKAVPAAAKALGVKLRIFKAGGPREIEDALTAMVRDGTDALLVGTFAQYWRHRTQIVELAARHRLPAMYPGKEFVEDGGLMAYSSDFWDLFRRLGAYAGKILNGANPADLPVEQLTKFQLSINLRTAKALGLTIPDSLLFRADKVIN